MLFAVIALLQFCLVLLWCVLCPYCLITQAENWTFPFSCRFDSVQSHPKFASIAVVAPLLFSRQLQMSADKLPQPMSLGEAVEKGIIANQVDPSHSAPAMLAGECECSLRF